MHDLKAKAVRAAVYSVAGRGFGITIRVASLMILGRLLSPRDYGLVTMVTAFTGMLNMFGALGLFQAAIQRDSLSEAESASLFWMNLAFGGLLTLTTIVAAPAISAFYQQPELLEITRVIALTFVITGAGVQHGVLLHRRMQFGVGATIEIVALMISLAISIVMAAAGCGYWALVSATITLPLASTAGLWVVTGWIPGRPRHGARAHVDATIWRLDDNRGVCILFRKQY